MTDRIILWAIRALGGVTKEQFNTALSFVVGVAYKHLTSEQKKAGVLEMLKNIGIEGATANWLLETALKWAKRVGKIE